MKGKIDMVTGTFPYHYYIFFSTFCRLCVKKRQLLFCLQEIQATTLVLLEIHFKVSGLRRGPQSKNPGAWPGLTTSVSIPKSQSGG
jgi:hypothetical protein